MRCQTVTLYGPNGPVEVNQEDAATWIAGGFSVEPQCKAESLAVEPAAPSTFDEPRQRRGRPPKGA